MLLLMLLMVIVLICCCVGIRVAIVDAQHNISHYDVAVDDDVAAIMML